MATSGNLPSVIFPWSDTKILADGLVNGEICLATALSQFGAVSRECLRVMEEYAREQSKAHLERKNKVEKMDKLINDLTEKCQGMQQALLYKEEKYDEKCREVERYKVICEMSAKVAVNDDIYYSDLNGVSNLCDFVDRENDELEKLANQTESRAFLEPRKNMKIHTKLSQSHMPTSNYLTPSRPDKMPHQAVNDLDDNCNDRDNLECHYVGGPCKRKPTPSSLAGSINRDAKLRDRFTLMGAVNVSPARGSSSELSANLNRPFLSDCSYMPQDHQNKRMKIALTGQSNEVMSSSRNAVHRLKQKFTERDLHRQVAGGCWTRIASRRKKEWPF